MHRIIMRSILFISTKRINKKGKAPIYCRITVNGRRCEISTGVFISPTIWDQDHVKETCKENIMINAALIKLKNRLNQIYFDLLYNDKPLTAEIVKEIYTGKSKQRYTFMELLDDFVYKQSQKTDATNTLKNYKTRRNTITKWMLHIKKRNMIPEEFNLSMAEKFLQYLTREKRYGLDYSNRAITFAKAVLTDAVKEGRITINPLLNLKLETPKPKAIVALNKEELQLLINTKFKCERIQNVVDMYVFQSHTGFAYADLFHFDYKKHVRIIGGREWIFKKRIKNEIEAIIPLFPIAKQLLIKYNFKFKVISNQKYNEYLKEITAALGINKILTTHTARKTFASISINDGYSFEAVAKMLGHASIRITQSTYAQVGMIRIQNEMQRLGYA